MSIRNSIKIDSWQKYQEIYSYSIQENKAFWAQVAQEKIKWRAPWREVSESCFEKGHIRWFLDGQLNVSENCVDRHLESGKADQTALIWVGNHENEVRRFTFRELHAEVCRVAVALEKVGIQKGDRVVLYLPSIPELAISLLACARIGAIHSVIFGGFSAQAIQSRIHDCQAKLVITADGGFRGDKWIDLKKTIDQALALNCPSVQNVIVLSRHPNQLWKPQARDLRWEDFIHDCGTTQGVTKQALMKGDEVERPLSEILRGRVSHETIRHPTTDKVLVEENELITWEAGKEIDKLGEMGLDKVMVRSPMTCQAALGICRLCYGMDLATGSMVEEGMAVGIIAAQSIGEPGTQLTMRTFHI
ncbi:hypothetical protein EBS43_06435, partial [bacterium]|nr:hypothetical protein [bacterium]